MTGLCILAPTAIALQDDEAPLTYINRGMFNRSCHCGVISRSKRRSSHQLSILGQYYIITLNDKQEFDGDIETKVILAFHDQQHRRVATSFWKFWLGQQVTTSSPRAIDIGKLVSKMVGS
jgi:hypothetical protein